MRLQILVPQYNEDKSIVKGLLDSINSQHGINFKDFEVLIGNDGSDVKLPMGFIKNYPFTIKYFKFDHAGVAETRQRLLEASDADYVMYCDADDMFLSNLGIYAIFQHLKNNYDILDCAFVEETKSSKGTFKYITHKKDLKFIHGKVFKRKYLMDNQITWYKDILYHEDGVFNTLAFACTNSIFHHEEPIYLWKWRDDSICREDPNYVLKTYQYMIYGSALLVMDLLQRGKADDAKLQVTKIFYIVYYTLNENQWLDPHNIKYREEVERWFYDYYIRHKQLYDLTDSRYKIQLATKIKLLAVDNGVVFEKYTFDEWIKHIEGLNDKS